MGQVLVRSQQLNPGDFVQGHFRNRFEHEETAFTLAGDDTVDEGADLGMGGRGGRKGPAGGTVTDPGTVGPDVPVMQGGKTDQVTVGVAGQDIGDNAQTAGLPAGVTAEDRFQKRAQPQALQFPHVEKEMAVGIRGIRKERK